MRNLLSSAHLRAAIVLVAVLMSDQLTKRIAAHAISPGEHIGVLPGLQLVHTHNRGVAFGLAAGDQLVVTLLVALALLALLAYFLTHASRPLVWLPTGLLLGGALGNLLDRIRTGSVTDFIQLPLGWPPFNLADLAIVLGVILLLFAIEAPRHAASEARGGQAGAGASASKAGGGQAGAGASASKAGGGETGAGASASKASGSEQG